MPAERAAAAASRLFFALWPDHTARERIAALAQALRRECGGRVPSTARLHLTLAFIGAATPQRQIALQALTRQLRAAPFELQFTRVASWPRQRLVWLGTDSVPAPLAQLVADLNAQLATAGMRAEKRPLVPHLTLLRDARAPVACLLTSPIAWRVAEYTLVQSVLSPRPRYEIVERFALGADI